MKTDETVAPLVCPEWELQSK